MGILIFGAICWLWPRETVEWIVTCIVAWIAAYLTVAHPDHTAPMGPFILWFAADYILIQMLFGLLHKHKRASATVRTTATATNDN